MLDKVLVTYLAWYYHHCHCNVTSQKIIICQNIWLTYWRVNVTMLILLSLNSNHNFSAKRNGIFFFWKYFYSQTLLVKEKSIHIWIFWKWIVRMSTNTLLKSSLSSLQNTWRANVFLFIIWFVCLTFFRMSPYYLLKIKLEIAKVCWNTMKSIDCS